MENQTYEIENVKVKFSHIYELEKKFNIYDVHLVSSLPKDTHQPIIKLCTKRRI